MTEPTEKRVSLRVVSPPREKPLGSGIPAAVTLSEPMRRFRCNQKGCCCSGWDIPFRLEDFLRLHEHLPDSERQELTKGIQLIIDSKEKGENGETILHSLKLDGVGEEQACRFLEPAGACRVHAQSGLDALPDLCIDFPAAAFHRSDGEVELWFDPVCPEVLAQLDESDAPLSLHRQEGPFQEPMMDLRVAHAVDTIRGRIASQTVSPASLDRMRALALQELGRTDVPAWQTLAVLVDGFSRLAIDTSGDIELKLDDALDTGPFLRFFAACIQAHGADLLAASLIKYKRFIHAIDPQPLVDKREELERHLSDWQPAFEQWLAPQDEVLAPLSARFLAHRFGTPMVKGRAELRAAADEIVHVYATAQRYAAAIGATLKRPVDRKLFSVALGASEFFFRSLRLPRPSLPWFASREQGVVW